MKKVLYLSLIASSIFSMQLDLVKFEKKANILQKKLFKQDILKLDDTNKMRIKPASVFVPHQLGSVELYHSNKGFCVYQDDNKQHIKKYFTDPILRDIKREQLEAFLKNGHLVINQMNDGEFSLKAKGHINGGGPLLGKAAYWVTKSFCYGVLLAAVTFAMSRSKNRATKKSKHPFKDSVPDIHVDTLTNFTKSAIVHVADSATVPLVIEAAKQSCANTVATGLKIVGTAPIKIGGNGITIVAEGIKLAGLGAQAGVISCAGANATAGTGWGIAAAIECVSVTVGLFFGMTPTP